jgi:penicillin-binding protein 2
MLQLASAQATLVAGGKRYAPRVVRGIEDAVSRETRILSSQLVLDMKLREPDVDVIKRAMFDVTQSGTATRVFAGAAYASGGKTGTAQAVTIRQNEKYNASRLAEYKRDHSLYTAFAPLDEPRIALAIVVENAGFGAEAAAQHYYRKSAAQLAPAEAARLAVMLPAPKHYEKQPGSPYLAQRARTILARMPSAQLP